MKPIVVEEVQHLLFDRSPFVPRGEARVADAFYARGWCILRGLPDQGSAQHALEQLIGGLDEQRLPLMNGFVSKLQLAKMNALPVCDDIVQTGFQALHYDMGMPFSAIQRQDLYAISALYRPSDSEPNETAKTRLVFIPDLAAQTTLADTHTLQKRLERYVEAHGDGWLQPSIHNTGRLAIFARVFDALSGQNRLSDKIDTMIGQCFVYDHSKVGEYGLAQEQAFFSDLGFHLNTIEEQIVLNPGEILVFDNMRCVHGRIGQRRKRELINMIYGVQNVSTATIDRYKQWLYELLAH